MGGGPDALPDEPAQSAAGFVVCLGLGVAGQPSTATRLLPRSSELGTFFSFQTAVDALEVADAVRPANSANAGLTLATARPPGFCNSLC